MLDRDVDTLQKDELTGFLTRHSLQSALQQLADDNGAFKLTVFAVEVSRFGVVNSSVGPGIADKVIATVAKRLRKMFPTAFAIARLHGDHFGVVFNHDNSLSENLDHLLDFSQRPIAIRGEAIVLSVRVGIADTQVEFETPYDLVNAAEIALLHSKKTMTKVSHFEKNMINDARTLHQLENDLRISLVTKAPELHKAISNSEFELFYQPIVDTKTGTIHAFEALLRWNHPKRGMVSPAVFIPLAEQIHVMSVLGNWIIRRACADAVSWGKSNVENIPPSVSINVSPIQFLEFDLLYSTLNAAIAETGISPQKIKIEITESANFSTSMRDNLRKIKNLGCQVALDDFGTGYSSIAQLVQLPLDYVKIDRSLVQELEDKASPDPARATKLARSVLNLAASLEVNSIVEGIETPYGLNQVNLLGAELIQGYVFSKPIPASEVEAFICNFKLG